MHVDALMQLSNAQALVATAVSTNVIDANIDRDIGKGEPLGVLIVVNVAADAASGDETYQFDVQTDSTAAFGAPVVVASRAIARGLLLAGTRWVIPLPPDSGPNRCFRLNYTLGGTTPSITVTAYLMPLAMIDSYAPQNDGIAIQ
jgi:hypothetical protein